VILNSAELIVAQRGQPGFAGERRYEGAKSATWAMPLLLGKDILVRDASGVMLLTSETK